MNPSNDEPTKDEPSKDEPLPELLQRLEQALEALNAQTLEARRSGGPGDREAMLRDIAAQAARLDELARALHGEVSALMTRQGLPESAE